MNVVDMLAAVKARTAARGWVTRASRNLNGLCRNEDVDRDELTEAVAEFDKRLAALDEAQTQVEMELPLEAIEQDVEAVGEFRSNVRAHRLAAGKRLGKLLSEEQLNGVNSRASVEAKLPRLELPKFNGNPLEWTAFWDQFSAVVDNTDLPDVSKLSYLQSLLGGEQGLPNLIGRWLPSGLPRIAPWLPNNDWWYWYPGNAMREMVAFGGIWRVNYKSKNRHIYLYVELFFPNQTERLSNSKVIKVSKSQVVSLKQQGQ